MWLQTLIKHRNLAPNEFCPVAADWRAYLSHHACVGVLAVQPDSAWTSFCLGSPTRSISKKISKQPTNFPLTPPQGSNSFHYSGLTLDTHGLLHSNNYIDTSACNSDFPCVIFKPQAPSHHHATGSGACSEKTLYSLTLKLTLVPPWDVFGQVIDHPLCSIV